MEHDEFPVDDENDTRACPACDASGFDDEDGSACGNCGGLGYVEGARGVPAPSRHPLPAQANDGGDHA